MGLICIADIHGMRKKFNEVWKLVDPSKEDTIIILGDFIDRGPDSKGVINDIIELKNDGYNIIALRGNHEDMFLSYLNKLSTLAGGEDQYLDSTEVRNIFMWNGGNYTMKSYNNKPPSKIHMKFINSTLIKYETNEYIFVHAGVNPKKSMNNQTELDYMWVREDFINSIKNFGKVVVFGHTPTFTILGHGKKTTPFFMKNKIGIDTGCVFGGKLTAMRLPEKEYVQV